MPGANKKLPPSKVDQIFFKLKIINLSDPDDSPSVRQGHKTPIVLLLRRKKMQTERERRKDKSEEREATIVEDDSVRRL